MIVVAREHESSLDTFWGDITLRLNLRSNSNEVQIIALVGGCCGGGGGGGGVQWPQHGYGRGGS